jgi:DNA-directed RNA polymerase specialized sigma24 family protein
VRKDFPLLDQAVATIGTLSRDEVESAISAFTPDELLRLRKVSLYYSTPGRLEADDLLQEATVRALDGSRKCPANISVVRFLAEAMRSIAHGEREKIKSGPVIKSLDSTDEREGVALDTLDPTSSIEDTMINQESAAILHDSVLSLFEAGTPERDMVEGIMAELSAEELRELLSLDKTAYDSTRKLIRRRLNKAYPKGWNHD